MRGGLSSRALTEPFIAKQQKRGCVLRIWIQMLAGGPLKVCFVFVKILSVIYLAPVDFVTINQICSATFI